MHYQLCHDQTVYQKLTVLKSHPKLKFDTIHEHVNTCSFYMLVEHEIITQANLRREQVGKTAGIHSPSSQVLEQSSVEQFRGR